MSLGLPNLSWWLQSGKKKDVKLQKGSSPELNLVEVDVLNYPNISGGGGNLGSKSRRVRRKWKNQEGGKIDRDHDIVLVPSDGESSSDYDSDASDWSIGWSEPHAPGFLSEDEMDGGFGVLVRCYGRCSGGNQDFRNNKSNNDAVVPAFNAFDGKKYMEQWLFSLQGN